MPLFSEQDVFCKNCGRPMRASCEGGTHLKFRNDCSPECRNELEWKYTLSILGKAYYPRPESEKR